MSNTKVSIIIPLYVDAPRFYADLKKFAKLNYPDYEILVVSDKNVKIVDPKVKVLITGKERTGPAEKRDIAIQKAKGEICAFIDDDAYPHSDWLKKAVVHFQHPQIAAVGGPGLTPKEDNYWEQLTGLVYGSFFCGGHAQYRFVKKPARFVVDYPAYNLLVRKSVLNDVGGYGTHFYGGEDTFLCLKIIKKGHKILYDPEVVVYHHRRPLFIPYLKQIANIGKHRGYFAKRFPETSFRWMYFLPSVLALGFFVLPFINWTLFVVLLVLSVGVGMCSVISKTNLWNSFLISLGIIGTHVVYGINFIRGLIFNNLER
ncbi:MAG: Glycosyltransferase [Candidatus Woesebacteria bacterium GW2011_GWA1_39_12]|uniref:Glycosyltransferase n=1 Tax=Candidatus Woesebacteria bacterium GW2011_GWA1_39_12 TaxID=1618549 RepID=A0A0G0LYL6_9BACT|nr:MAG: Glycosyltransferase [Candidatus Woesebacteria bacterium GW2011_GWA1_39_12]